MEFNSQICTTKEQSERLLALGLKKETADCRHWAYTKDSKGVPIPKRSQKWFTRIGADESAQVCGFMDATFIPAWSLHRLIEVLGVSKMAFNMDIYDSPYEEIIHRIEIFVNAGEFNKEYLEE